MTDIETIKREYSFAKPYFSRSDVGGLLDYIDELEAYANKLADGLPDGILPKDVENLRAANAEMAQQVHELQTQNTYLIGRKGIDNWTNLKATGKLSERIAELETTIEHLKAESAHTTYVKLSTDNVMLIDQERELKAENAYLRAKVANLEAEYDVMKARCTWKRALEVQPPLNKLVIVLKEFYGVSCSQFEIINGRLYFFKKPGDLIGYEVMNDTFWCEMPDFPEVQP